jgi:phospholipid transport system transporter-binding protein
VPAPTSVAAPFELRRAERQVTLTGVLTFASAQRARQLGIDALAAAPAGDVEIDCAGITQADSAGLTVLIDWLAFARRAQRRLRYLQLPAGINALARISEVQELLESGV